MERWRPVLGWKEIYRHQPEDVKAGPHRRQHFLEKRWPMMARFNIEVQTIRGSDRNLFGKMR